MGAPWVRRWNSWMPRIGRLEFAESKRFWLGCHFSGMDGSVRGQQGRSVSQGEVSLDFGQNTFGENRLCSNGIDLSRAVRMNRALINRAAESRSQRFPNRDWCAPKYEALWNILEHCLPNNVKRTVEYIRWYIIIGEKNVSHGDSHEPSGTNCLSVRRTGFWL